MYLFPNLKGNNIDEIKDKYDTDNVRLLFDKIHDKYSVSHDEIRTYHHYFYEIDIIRYSFRHLAYHWLY